MRQLDFIGRHTQSRDETSPERTSGTRHEICDYRGNRAGLRNIGRRSCECAKRAARSVAALHGARRLFRRVAVCADRLLARQGDAPSHPAKRRRLFYDLAGADALAGSAAAARPSVSRLVRPGQSGPPAIRFRCDRQICLLILLSDREDFLI